MPISYKNKIYTTLGTPTELSGNVVSVTNSSGVPAKDYTVKGRTIVWNQMLQNPNYSNTVVDTRAYVQFMVVQNVSPYKIFLSLELQKPGLVSGIFTVTASGECRIKHNGSKADIVFCYFTSVKDHKYYIYFNFTSTNPTMAGGITYDKAQLFDLTKMFGAGNEPSTPAEFRAMFPDDYYPYNVGELKSVAPTSIEASSPIRFNLLDTSGFTEKVNTINAGITAKLDQDKSIYVTGTATGDGGRNSWGLLVNLIATHKYYVAQIIDDMNGPFLSMVGRPSKYFSGQFISCDLSGQYNFGYNVKAGVTYDKHIYPMVVDLTEMYGAGNEPTTASAIPSFWGYNPDTYKRANIPSSKYFPDGMKSAGSVYDEINFLSQKAIKRIGAVDMGTLNWHEYDFTDYSLFYANISTKNNTNPECNVICQRYSNIKDNATSVNNAAGKLSLDKSITGFYAESSNNSWVYVKDTSYTDATTFKAAMSGVMLYYELATPVETPITPPLQALQTFKGFTSFSAPNSLMQNGPLSVTYYAEGGASPEKGWLTSYKRKLYMGRDIEWNQLFTNSATSSNGVTISNNQDGTMTLNGTANVSWINFTNLSDAMNQVHKYLLCLKILNNPDSVSFSYGWLNRYRMQTDVISNGESCTICNQTETLTQLEKSTGLASFAAGTVFNNVKIAVMVMDLTQMFGAGNEPATPEEFWSYFDHKLYPYNAGETQPLFKISRKSQWGTASLYDYTFDETMGVLTLNKAPHSQSGDTLTIL